MKNITDFIKTLKGEIATAFEDRTLVKGILFMAGTFWRDHKKRRLKKNISNVLRNLILNTMRNICLTGMLINNVTRYGVVFAGT